MVFFLIIALATIYPGKRAYACTPPPMAHQNEHSTGPDVERLPSIAERTETAEVVLLGTVESVDGLLPQTAFVKVQFYLKGAEGPDLVEIRGFGPSSLCLSPIQVGVTLIFFADGDPYSPMYVHYSPWRDSDGNTTGFKGQFNGAAPGTVENIQEVHAEANQESVAPLPTITTPTIRPDTPTPSLDISTPAMPAATPTSTPTGPSGGGCNAPAATANVIDRSWVAIALVQLGVVLNLWRLRLSRKDRRQ